VPTGTATLRDLVANVVGADRRGLPSAEERQQMGARSSLGLRFRLLPCRQHIVDRGHDQLVDRGPLVERDTAQPLVGVDREVDADALWFAPRSWGHPRPPRPAGRKSRNLMRGSPRQPVSAYRTQLSNAVCFGH